MGLDFHSLSLSLFLFLVLSLYRSIIYPFLSNYHRSPPLNITRLLSPSHISTTVKCTGCVRRTFHLRSFPPIPKHHTMPDDGSSCLAIARVVHSRQFSTWSTNLWVLYVSLWIAQNFTPHSYAIFVLIMLRLSIHPLLSRQMRYSTKLLLFYYFVSSFDFSFRFSFFIVKHAYIHTCPCTHYIDAFSPHTYVCMYVWLVFLFHVIFSSILPFPRFHCAYTLITHIQTAFFSVHIQFFFLLLSISLIHFFLYQFQFPTQCIVVRVWVY